MTLFFVFLLKLRYKKIVLAFSRPLSTFSSFLSPVSLMKSILYRPTPTGNLCSAFLLFGTHTLAIAIPLYSRVEIRFKLLPTSNTLSFSSEDNDSSKQQRRHPELRALSEKVHIPDRSISCKTTFSRSRLHFFLRRTFYYVCCTFSFSHLSIFLSQQPHHHYHRELSAKKTLLLELLL